MPVLLEDENLKKIADPLVEWYRENKRELPWREQISAYRVWVSEIMLQQTRVEAVKPFYARFLNALPTVKDLAEAEEDQLLKLWEGLGYYNRSAEHAESGKADHGRFSWRISQDLRGDKKVLQESETIRREQSAHLHLGFQNRRSMAMYFVWFRGSRQAMMTL